MSEVIDAKPRRLKPSGLPHVAYDGNAVLERLVDHARDRLRGKTA